MDVGELTELFKEKGLTLDVEVLNSLCDFKLMKNLPEDGEGALKKLWKTYCVGSWQHDDQFLFPTIGRELAARMKEYIDEALDGEAEDMRAADEDWYSQE